MSWLNSGKSPTAPNGESLGALPLSPNGPPLFMTNPAATPEDLVEFADVSLDAINNALTLGVADGLGADECYALQVLLSLSRSAIRSVIGQP